MFNIFWNWILFWDYNSFQSLQPGKLSGFPPKTKLKLILVLVMEITLEWLFVSSWSLCTALILIISHCCDTLKKWLLGVFTGRSSQRDSSHLHDSWLITVTMRSATTTITRTKEKIFHLGVKHCLVLTAKKTNNYVV